VKPGVSQLAERLRMLGCIVTETPCAEFVPLTGPGSPLAKALDAVENYAWLAFTSAAGINAFFDHCAEAGTDVRSLHCVKIACVGAETERELRRRGIMAAYRPAEYHGEALARGLAELIRPGERLLIARAKDGAEELTQILSGAGVAFDDIAVYEKKWGPGSFTLDPGFDFAAFTSSSGVEQFVLHAKDVNLENVKAVCIGARTAAAALSHGMEVHVAAEATVDGMVEKIKGLFECK